MITTQRYLAREAVFKTLRNHPGLIVRDDESDTSFVNFYNTMLGSNTYLIDSLQTLINNRRFVEADTLLARFTEENEQEYNYKKVYTATILWMVNGEEAIDDVMREELDVIAHQHPLFGGYAVYVARNLLNLEIYDNNSGSYRLMGNKVENKPFSVLIQPNPGRDYIYIICSDGDTPDRIRIQTIEGKDIDLPIANSIVDLTQLPPGIYLCTVSKSGNTVINKFIKL